MVKFPAKRSETFRIEQGEDQIGAEAQGHGQAEKRLEHDGSPSGAREGFGVERHEPEQDEAKDERDKIGQETGHDALLSVLPTEFGASKVRFRW
jgi:hypothetical protein